MIAHESYLIMLGDRLLASASYVNGVLSSVTLATNEHREVLTVMMELPVREANLGRAEGISTTAVHTSKVAGHHG